MQALMRTGEANLRRVISLMLTHAALWDCPGDEDWRVIFEDDER